MKIRKTLSLLFSSMFLLTGCFSIAGCGNNNANKTPQEIIEDVFGNKEFKISFSSKTLDKPLKSMNYSSNRIPKLPTPLKVGYIFEGWFFDPQFTMPYSDDALFLYMKDVTLYPKWTKETFVHNGTYDIEFDANIVEKTVKKGKTTDEYGGYKDFSKAIQNESCHIEKNEDELILKLQFDCGLTVPFQSSGEVYSVRINKEMNTDIYIKDKINSLSDSVKTLFIKINSWDLSEPLYLDVAYTNFENKKLTENNRYDTTTTYTVELNLTKIIGFSQSFVDPELPLEKGYYLAKSYLRQENNTESMAKTFNPVYSYLYSDGNKHYKLIKQNIPYTGLVADKHPLYNPITDNYYDTLMAFTGIMTMFDIDSRNAEGVVSSDYYPETYNGGYYRDCSIEFHADTGKIYNIVDLDSDLSKEYLALTAVSGYMERGEGMGYIRQILSIDYKNLIMLPEVDYKPIVGDSYEYSNEFNYYPGNYADLDQKNLTFDATKDYGVSIEMPNFYYQAPAMYAPLDQRKILNSRVDIIPRKESNAKPTKDSRREIALFDVKTKVFGYNVKDGERLFLDRMRPQSFEGKSYNNQLRDITEVKCGKFCKDNEEIFVADLFHEKVNKDIDFSAVKFQAYEMDGNNINWGKTVFIKDKKLNFKNNIAIEFSYVDGDGAVKSVVELKKYVPFELSGKKSDGMYDFKDGFLWQRDDDNHFTKASVDKVGDRVKYPDVLYTWGNVKGSFIENYYEDSSGYESINPSTTVMFGVREGYYITYLITSHSNEFDIPERELILMYQLENEYGEREYIYFNYNSDPKQAYTIKDNNGEVIGHDDIKFDKDTGQRINVYCSFTGGVYYENFDETMLREYTHTENGYTDKYTLSYYNIYSSDGDLKYLERESGEAMSLKINEFLKDKAFGMITFVYTHDSDILEVDYLYKITFNGVASYKALDYTSFFTDTAYTLTKTNLVGSDMRVISTLWLDVNKYVDGRPSISQNGLVDYDVENEGSQYKIIFKAPGTYRINMRYRIASHILGDDLTTSRTIEFYQMVDVQSSKGDIKITYETDNLHPFNGGGTERTVTYNLGDGINFMPFDSKNFNVSDFGEGRSADTLFLWSTTGYTSGDTFKPKQFINSEDYIRQFNSNHIVLKAIWEIKFVVNCDINGRTTQVTGELDSYYKVYTVTFPRVRPADIPKGKIFAGWTGGFLGDRIETDKSVKLPYRDDYHDMDKYRDYFKIRAVFKSEYTLTFNVDPAIAWSIAQEKVVEGEMLSNPSAKNHIQFKGDAEKEYEFLGWYIKGDTTETLVDLSTYVVTDNVTFVAKFSKK